MIVINVPNENLVDKEGEITKPWENYFDQSTQQMQQSLSNEGFWIPSVTASRQTIIAASLGQQGGANAGTLIFDPDVVNGGTIDAPNGQYKVLLADGSFHLIPNL